MMGGLPVAWQVNVTLSPSRTERGSMERVTVGGSAQEKTGPMFNVERNRLNESSEFRLTFLNVFVTHFFKSKMVQILCILYLTNTFKDIRMLDLGAGCIVQGLPFVSDPVCGAQGQDLNPLSGLGSPGSGSVSDFSGPSLQKPETGRTLTPGWG